MLLGGSEILFCGEIYLFHSNYPDEILSFPNVYSIPDHSFEYKVLQATLVL